jgi:hypothetical protein
MCNELSCFFNNTSPNLMHIVISSFLLSETLNHLCISFYFVIGLNVQYRYQ